MPSRFCVISNALRLRQVRLRTLASSFFAAGRRVADSPQRPYFG
jgi:hypothetical protein